MKNIVETAIEAGNFETLVAAVKAAGLVDVLSGNGPFTVFAPADDAFAKVPKDMLDATMADKNKLAGILKYHVVSGKMMAKEIAGEKELQTLQGGSLKVDASDGVEINGAKVVKADIECSNGVIHVIDSVLMPL
ncbi:MAG: fasciclin domain-containing protein [Candidatus Pacebacteria bacterium]|jgi:uncharacterized surface protein with fasciclin (FAS1) repeats|nr:fasciclin domain-containing protein [Candidatus Paceibacterota bacterium]